MTTCVTAVPSVPGGLPCNTTTMFNFTTTTSTTTTTTTVTTTTATATASSKNSNHYCCCYCCYYYRYFYHLAGLSLFSKCFFLVWFVSCIRSSVELRHERLCVFLWLTSWKVLVASAVLLCSCWRYASGLLLGLIRILTLSVQHSYINFLKLFLNTCECCMCVSGVCKNKCSMVISMQVLLSIWADIEEDRRKSTAWWMPPVGVVWALGLGVHVVLRPFCTGRLQWPILREHS